MARVFQKRGEWWMDFRGPDGRRHREPVGDGATHSLAKQVLAKRQAQAAEHRHFPGRVANGRRFSELSAKFWELHGQRLRSNTWRYMMPKFNATFGTMRLGDITAGDVQKLYNEIAARRSHSTARRYLTLLRLIFNKGRAWGDFHGDNPCLGVKMGREANHRVRYLTHPEIERLRDACHPRLLPVVACALLTGMRRGEILGLSWEHVDVERGRLHILRSKSGVAREVPISDRLRSVLVSVGGRQQGPVFDLPVITLRKFFGRALKAAGISGVRFHDLRHTFASHYIMAGGDLLTLSRLLGHSTTAMTQRYAHLASDFLGAKMAALEAAMPIGSAAPTLSGHQGWHQPPTALLPVV